MRSTRVRGGPPRCWKRMRVRMTSDVLIVDDEPEVREAIAAILGDEGYEVRHAAEAAPRSRRSTLGHPA